MVGLVSASYRCYAGGHRAGLISSLAGRHLPLMNCKSKPSELWLRQAAPRLPLHHKLHSWPSKQPRSCPLQSRRTCRASSAGPQRHRQSLQSMPSSQLRVRHAKRQPRLSWTLSSTDQSQCISHWCLTRSHRLIRPPTANLHRLRRVEQPVRACQSRLVSLHFSS